MNLVFPKSVSFCEYLSTFDLILTVEVNLKTFEILLKIISEDLGLMNTPHEEFTIKPSASFHQILHCAVFIIFSAF